jgi:4-diphosphocytidyl-2-C-methyl-D-erythritol kinase
MAGGSADAAAALVACDALWGLSLSRARLEELAAELGSDVPFLLGGGTSMGSGRGEILAPVLARGTYHWVFALSEGGLSTPQVYAECDRLRAGREVPEPSPSPKMMQALRSGDARALGAALTNDLQAAAISLMPALGDVLDAGLEFGALGGIVSGSGPTVAFLAEDHESALDLAVSLTASGAVQDVRRAIGPAHGAHVVGAPRA